MCHPIHSRLRRIAGVTELRGGWVKGYLLNLPKPCFELSFERAQHSPTLPGTQLTYLGLWCGKRTLFEFQLGSLVVVPDQGTFDQYVSPLILALRDYRHLQVDL